MRQGPQTAPFVFVRWPDKCFESHQYHELLLFITVSPDYEPDLQNYRYTEETCAKETRSSIRTAAIFDWKK